jgi:type III secretion protein T
MTESLKLLATLPLFLICITRVAAALLVIPFFGQTFLTGIARNVVAISISPVLVPFFLPMLAKVSLSAPMLAVIALKEGFFGVSIGLVVSLPYWVAESAGFFIDNQKGATLASVFNPFFNDQTSPIGLLFVQVLTVIYFTVGGFGLTLDCLFNSYLLFPPLEIGPSLPPAFGTFFTEFLGSVMKLVVLYSAPVLLVMFLAEFGLGLINRFAPQLNVFSLSLGVKAGVASLMLVVYLGYLVLFFKKIIWQTEELHNTLLKILGS